MATTKRRPLWVHVVEFLACYSLVLVPMLMLASNATDGDEFYKAMPGMLPKLLDLLRETRSA